MSNTSVDLPEPERPENTISLFFGRSRSRFLRLCSRAPRMRIESDMDLLFFHLTPQPPLLTYVRSGGAGALPAGVRIFPTPWIYPATPSRSPPRARRRRSILCRLSRRPYRRRNGRSRGCRRRRRPGRARRAWRTRNDRSPARARPTPSPDTLRVSIAPPGSVHRMPPSRSGCWSPGYVRRRRS